MKNKKNVLLLSIIIVVICLLYLGKEYKEGKGMMLVSDDKQFTKEYSHEIEGNYALTLDLANLKSTIDQVIFHDEHHKIYVHMFEVEKTGQFRKYTINFRSSGIYDRNFASLISGIKHSRFDNGSINYELVAKMNVAYNNQIIEATPTGVSGLNYKDGDDFSFTFILPVKPLFEEKNVESDFVTLTLTNLYKNVWSK